MWCLAGGGGLKCQRCVKLPNSGYRLPLTYAPIAEVCPDTTTTRHIVQNGQCPLPPARPGTRADGYVVTDNVRPCKRKGQVCVKGACV